MGSGLRGGVSPGAFVVAFGALGGLGASAACRSLVGIDDLTIASDASTETASDAAPDVGEDVTGDAGAETSPGDGGAVDGCVDIPVTDGSTARAFCIARCKGDAGPAAVGELFGAPQGCFCNACDTACRRFCIPACGHVAGLPECDDCVVHSILDDGGPCRGTVNCTSAECMGLARCLSGCGP